MNKLRDWVPFEFEQSFMDTQAAKYLDVKVVKEYDMLDDDWEQTWKSWPGTHKNVKNWCVLENGYAVGWNENESRGWSFPVKRIGNV